jgi:hypothetical protein
VSSLKVKPRIKEGTLKPEEYLKWNNKIWTESKWSVVTTKEKEKEKEAPKGRLQNQKVDLFCLFMSEKLVDSFVLTKPDSNYKHRLV